MFAHAHYTKLSHVCTKMAKLKSDFTRLSVWLSTILEFHNKMAFISGPSLHQLSEHIFEILQDLTYSWWDQVGHTRTHYHKPTLGFYFIIMQAIRVGAAARWKRLRLLRTFADWHCTCMPVIWPYGIRCICSMSETSITMIWDQLSLIGTQYYKCKKPNPLCLNSFSVSNLINT